MHDLGECLGSLLFSVSDTHSLSPDNRISTILYGKKKSSFSSVDRCSVMNQILMQGFPFLASIFVVKSSDASFPMRPGKEFSFSLHGTHLLVGDNIISTTFLLNFK